MHVKDGDHNAHHVFLAHIKAHLLSGQHERHVERLVAHHAAGDRHCGVRLLYALLHLDTELFILTNKIEEAAHQLIPLILEQLVASAGGDELALEVCQLHSRGVDV